MEADFVLDWTKRGNIMSMQITIEVPNNLGNELQRYHERLPEVLERGLREIMQEQIVSEFKDQTTIIEFLASRPSPEKVLALKPSADFQARASKLLRKSKTGAISHPEETELERILILEHLVRLAKSQAYKHLARV